MGRRGPKEKPIDLGLVELLASYGCTIDQIVPALKVSRTTFYDRKAVKAEISDAIKNGRAKGDGDLLKAAYLHAIKGNTALIIFLLKNRLGYRNDPIVEDDEVEADNQEAIALDVALPDGKSVMVTFRQEASVKELADAAKGFGPEK